MRSNSSNQGNQDQSQKEKTRIFKKIISLFSKLKSFIQKEEISLEKETKVIFEDEQACSPRIYNEFECLGSNILGNLKAIENYFFQNL